MKDVAMCRDLNTYCIEAIVGNWSNNPSLKGYFYEMKVLTFLIMNHYDCNLNLQYHRLKAPTLPQVVLKKTTLRKVVIQKPTLRKAVLKEPTLRKAVLKKANAQTEVIERIVYKGYVQKTDGHYIKITSVSRFQSDGVDLAEQMKSFISLPVVNKSCRNAALYIPHSVSFPLIDFGILIPNISIGKYRLLMFQVTRSIKTMNFPIQEY